MRLTLAIFVLVLAASIPSGATPALRFLCGGAACSAAASDTVVDAVTGLEWERNPAQGDYTWVESLTHCNNLVLAGHDDWRLPNMKELWSLFDFTTAIGYDKVAFPTTRESFTWSSSPFPPDTTQAWGVYFNYGGANNNAPAVQKYPARCVR